MKLIAGLGNPGKKYIHNRHNIGFRVIEELARRNSIRLKKRFFDRAALAGFKSFDKDLLLIQPLAFMNRSGDCLVHYLNKYHLSPDDLLVVCDDINLPLGQLRLRPQGSAGGHNGLDSIIRALKTTAFPRLRIGISREPAAVNFREFVLSDFEKEELLEVEEVVGRAGEACICWAKEGIDKAMNVYNVSV